MRLRRMLLLVLVVGVMAVGMAGVAFAATSYVGGGKWNYGVVRGGNVYSNYLHNYNCHSSSVRTSYLTRSGPTAPGYWARASAPERPYRADQSYWNNRC